MVVRSPFGQGDQDSETQQLLFYTHGQTRLLASGFDRSIFWDGNLQSQMVPTLLYLGTSFGRNIAY